MKTRALPVAAACVAFASLAALACAPVDDGGLDDVEASSDELATHDGAVDAILHRAITAGRFPGAVVRSGSVRFPNVPDYQRAYGTTDYGRANVTGDTVYDLASVTKVLATTVVAMVEVDQGRLDLDKSVRDYLPDLGAGFGHLTTRALLAHRSCFPDGPPRGSLAGARRDGSTGSIVAWFDEKVAAPPRSCGSVLYSDLNLLLTTAVVQKTSGKRLDDAARGVYGPLGLTSTGFNPTQAPLALRLDRIAPTERYPDGRPDRSGRTGLVHGVVHDELSYYFGGLGGNAGLFSTAGDVSKLLKAILEDRVVRRATRNLFFAPQGGGRALGWELAPAHCAVDGAMGSLTVGHTGFTGTSVCMDPEQGTYTVVLTNRVHPSRERGSIHGDRVALVGALVEKADPCRARAQWTGLCGSTPQVAHAGQGDVLYECRARKATVCATGCFVAPQGQADRCCRPEDRGNNGCR